MRPDHAPRDSSGTTQPAELPATGGSCRRSSLPHSRGHGARTAAARVIDHVDQAFSVMSTEARSSADHHSGRPPLKCRYSPAPDALAWHTTMYSQSGLTSSAHEAALMRRQRVADTDLSSVVPAPTGLLGPFCQSPRRYVLLGPERGPHRRGGAALVQRRSRPSGPRRIQHRLEAAGVACDLRDVTRSGMGTDWRAPQAEQAGSTAGRC